MTLSGFPSAGYADGTNGSARFCNPYMTASDAAGNLYLADSGNNAIRMLSPSGTNWVVTTIAGSSSGLAGTNDGPGDIAQFHSPEGVATDTAGNIYVADTLNSTIRMITPNGTNWTVTTLAGSARHAGNTDGTNSGALFYFPTGLAVNETGTIYVADQFNNYIRKIVPSGTNWVVSTITALATGTNFSNPTGVAVHTNDNVYVADTGNGVIRLITPGGSVSTLVGTIRSFGTADGTNQAARFQSPAGVAIDPSGNLYVTDSKTVRKIAAVVTTNVVTHLKTTNWVVTTPVGSATIAGSADGTNNAALFAYAAGITVDGAGNVYTTETLNNTVRKISQSGTNWTVTTIAGILGSVGATDGAGSAARYYLPAPTPGSCGVAVDATGNLYVADTRNDTIRRITPAGVSTTIAGQPQTPGFSDGTNNAARFNSPSGVVLDSAGNVYVADWGNKVIRRITPVGTNWVVTTLANSAGNLNISSSGVLAVDANSNIYVAQPLGAVLRVSPTGTNWTATALPGLSPLYGIQGLVADTNGNVFATYGHAVWEIAPSGSNWTATIIAGQVSNTPGSTDGTNGQILFNSPSGITLDGAGNIYVADSANCTIRRLSQSGTNWVSCTLAGKASAIVGPGFAGSADGTGNVVRFNDPSGIAVDTNGNLYVTDAYNNTIRKGWLADTAPAIMLSPPIVTDGQVQFSFVVATGSANSFELLQADQPTGPWTTNSAAQFTPIVSGISYTVLIPLGGMSEFYRIQSP